MRCCVVAEAFAREVDADMKVKQLVEMGFEEAAVVAALAKSGGDENAAMEALCGG
jgi:ubiquitin-conjugating enzyme (huntingtin interacting protein 2)